MVPGSSSASWPVLRPFSGSDCTVLPEITSPTVVDSVCRIGEAAVTSTVSCDRADRHPEVEAGDLPGLERDRGCGSRCGSPTSSAFTS